MCGIAGIAHEQGAPPPDPAVLGRLSEALAHRGPDGMGTTIIGRIAMVHRRLAIMDPEGGDQPLFAGNASLVTNGEIYNDPELRASMPEVRFATGSDSEPPLHLWLACGPDYVHRLRGMYAIAIHERSARSLTLSRDPFGIKPLYVAPLAHGIAFASEAQALLVSGLVPRGIRRLQRDELLQLQFTTGMDTIFPGIQRVLPGETLGIVDGHVISRTRTSPLDAGGPETIGRDEALARLDRALEDSVVAHLRSDVGSGLFLSGGIDSAAIAHLMRRAGGRIRSFTARFEQPDSADESSRAEAVARAVGADHETLTIDEGMVWRHLPEIVACMDDPVADYAIIPTWLLARRARRDVKVILSGEGGDEIFGGYGRYRRAMLPWWRGGRRMRTRGAFDGLGVLRQNPSGWRDQVRASESSAMAGGRTRLAASQAADMDDWLPNDLLLKLDRCLMAHGVEGRTPFLDPLVSASAFRLPDALKVRDGQGKFLLRTWLAANLPESAAFERKQGFTVPIGGWIANAGDRLGRLVADREAIAEIAEPDRVRALFRAAGGKRERHAAWTLLFYALWHRTHVEGLAASGNVFETLASG